VFNVEAADIVREVEQQRKAARLQSIKRRVVTPPNESE